MTENKQENNFLPVSCLYFIFTGQFRRYKCQIKKQKHSLLFSPGKPQQICTATDEVENKMLWNKKQKKKKKSTITKKPKTKQKKPKQAKHLRFCCCLACSWSSWIPSQWIFSSLLHIRSKQCTLPWVVHPALMGAPMVPAESWDPYLVTLLKSALTDGTLQQFSRQQCL